MSKVAWFLRRTVEIDGRFLRIPEVSLTNKVHFLGTKYRLLSRHLARAFSLGKDSAMVFGERVFYNTRWGIFDYQRMLVTYGEWLREIELTPNAVVVDVGANVGIFAKFIRQIFPRSHLFCFEPIPQTFECLQRNFAGVEGVTLANVALGATAGTAKMKFDPQNSIFSSITETGGVDVKTDTLDNVVRVLGIKQIDLLKIDTEGHESLVLAGAHEALKLTRYLLIEVQIEATAEATPNYTLTSLMAMLATEDYEFQSLFYRNFLDNSEGRMPSFDLLLKNIRWKAPT